MTEDQINEKIREWHSLPGVTSQSLPLYQFFGWTEEEYDTWLTARIDKWKAEKAKEIIDKEARAKEYEAGAEERKKEWDLQNTCPECGLTDVYVEPYGISGTLGDVKCSSCHAYVRSWDAY